MLLHLHATDFVAQSSLGGGGILEFAALYVALLGSCIPGAQADFDVYYAGVLVAACHIFQLHQLPAIQLHSTIYN